MSLVCSSCPRTLRIVDDILVTSDEGEPVTSFFDAEHPNMQLGQADRGTAEIFYRQQVEMLDRINTRAACIVDIGCGPALPYQPPEKSYVIGVDPSFHSLRKNGQVALRIQGSAQALPIASGVADVVVCFYSVHHMTGRKIAENESLVRGAIREIRRILAPDGVLLIFEVNPIGLVRSVQKAFWNLAKTALKHNLDAYFWDSNELPMIIRAEWPAQGTALAHAGHRAGSRGRRASPAGTWSARRC